MNAIVNLCPSPATFEKIELADGSEISVDEDARGLGVVFKSIVDSFIGQLVSY